MATQQELDFLKLQQIIKSSKMPVSTPIVKPISTTPKLPATPSRMFSTNIVDRTTEFAKTPQGTFTLSAADALLFGALTGIDKKVGITKNIDAMALNPKSQIAGTIVGSLAPFGLADKALKGVKLFSGTKLATNLARGAVSGSGIMGVMGAIQQDTPEQIAKDVAIGAVFGAAGDLLIGALAKGIKLANGKMAKKVSDLVDATDDEIDVIAKSNNVDPIKLRNIVRKPLAEKVDVKAQKLQSDLNKALTKYMDAFEQSGGVKTRAVAKALNKIDDIESKLNVTSGLRDATFPTSATKPLPTQPVSEAQIAPVSDLNVQGGTTVSNAPLTSKTGDLVNGTIPSSIPLESKKTLIDRIKESLEPKPMGILPENMDVMDFDKASLKASVKNTRLNTMEALFNRHEFWDNDISKRQTKQGLFLTARDMFQRIRNTMGSVESQLEDGFVYRNGDIDPSLSYRNIYNRNFAKGGKKFNDYLLNLHHIDRMSISHQAKKELQDFEIRNQSMAGLPDNMLDDFAKTSEEANIKVSEYRDLIKQVELAKDKPVLKQTREKSVDFVNKIEAQHPEFKQMHKELSDYWDKVMNEYVVGDFMTPQAFADLKLKYPNYVPTYRIVSNLADNFGAVIGVKGGYRAKGTSVNTPITEAVGSIDEIIPLADQFPMLIAKYMKASRKNDAVVNFYNTVTQDPEKWSDVAKIVDTSKDTVKKLDVENIDEAIDDFDSVGAKEVKRGIYTINGYANGKKITIQVNGRAFKEMRDILGVTDEGFGQKAYDVNQKLGRTFTDPFKSVVTGHNPLFGVRNISRDIPTGFIQSINGTPLEHSESILSAIKKMSTGDADYLKYRATGAHMAGFYDIEKGFEKSFSNIEGSNLFQRSWDRIGKVNESLEQVNRFAEYLSAIKKYGDTPEGRIKAMSDGAEVTTNFSRNGYLIKAIDAWVPYLNAAMQGIRKSGSTMLDKPIPAISKGVATITVPALILDTINRDNPHYQELDNRQKDTYFLVPDYNSLDENGFPEKFIKIPKAREYGTIFANLFERSRRMASGEDNAWKGFGESVKTNFLPPTQWIGKPLTEALFKGNEGKDFAGRYIIPRSLWDTDPWAQYDEKTSRLALSLGDATKGLPNNMQISPKKVDYLINNYGSWVGQIFLGANAQNSKSVLDSVSNALLSPVNRSFSADSLFANQNVGDFYDLLQKKTSEAATFNKVNKINPDAVTPIERQRNALNKIAIQMSKLSKVKMNILGNPDLSKTEKENAIREVQRAYIELAKRGVAMGERFGE